MLTIKNIKWWCPECCDDDGGVCVMASTVHLYTGEAPAMLRPERGNTPQWPQWRAAKKRGPTFTFYKNDSASRRFVKGDVLNWVEWSWIILLKSFFWKAKHGRNCFVSSVASLSRGGGWRGGFHWRITRSIKRNKVCKAPLSPELCKGRV